MEGEAEGKGAKRACLPHHNHKRGRCVKRSNFIVCAERMMSNQLHGIVLMVLLFDVLVFNGSLLSHHGGGGRMGLVVVY